MLVHCPGIIGDEAAGAWVIAVVEELKLLDRRIRCAGRTAAAVGRCEPPINPLLCA